MPIIARKGNKRKELKRPPVGAKHTQKKAKGKNNAPAIKGLVNSEVFGLSGKEDLQNIIFNIHGPAGGGKTFAACSASKYWPAQWPPKKPTILRDIMHIGWDKAALVGLAQAKVKVAYRVDVPKLIADGKAADVLEASEIVMNEAIRICQKDPQIKICINDTITRMDKFLNAFWFSEGNVIRTNSGDEDTRRTYLALFRTHHEYQAAFTLLPVQNIFCFHSMVLEAPTEGKEEQRKATRARQDILRLNKDTYIVPEITGKSAGVYLGDSSTEFACLPARNPRTNKIERWLYPLGSQGYRGKNRFQDILGEKEPANLRKLLDRIERAM